jgi:hypothetical protein
MEQTHDLVNAIIVVHVMSDTGGELPPITLKHIGIFAEYTSLIPSPVVTHHC